MSTSYPATSAFSNDAAGAQASAQAYVRALLDLLGDRDPLAVQAALLDRLREAVDGLDGQALRRPEAPGKWSILEVAAHLADSELVYGYRMRLILAEDTPAIPGYDQDAWASKLRYNEADLDLLLDQLAAQRTANLALLRSLSEEEWERTGLHSERGVESVRQIARLLAAHDLVHLRQIDRIKRAHGIE